MNAKALNDNFLGHSHRPHYGQPFMGLMATVSERDPFTELALHLSGGQYVQRGSLDGPLRRPHAYGQLRMGPKVLATLSERDFV